MFHRYCLTAYLMLLTVAFVWGATFVFVKAALEAIGPFTFLAARFWLAFIVLGVPFLTRLWRGGRPLWSAGGVLGSVLCAACVFQTVGLGTTTGRQAASLPYI